PHTGTARTTRRRPGGRGSRPLRTGPVQASPEGVRSCPATRARTWRLVRSPRARGPLGGRAAPREPPGGRRRARGSRCAAHEPEASRLVPDLPAGRLDLGAQAICLPEVAADPRRLTALGQVDDVRRGLLVLGE